MKMRLYPQIYPENSFLEPGNHVSSMPGRAGTAALPTAKLVRSNIPVDGLSENGIDFAAVEAQARAARSAWVGSKLKSFYESLVRKFERAGAAERENYLAASQCLAELEERIRIEERMQTRSC